jgi:hypothetical protein
LSGELQVVRTELRADIGALRTELLATQTGLRGDVASMRGDMGALRHDMTSGFRWLVGVQVLFVVALVGALAAAVFRA